MTHVTCRLTANNRDQLRNLRSAVEYVLPVPFFIVFADVLRSARIRVRGGV